jgi:hypothetical protein
MKRGSLRSVLLGSAAATMLVASAGTASAIEYNFGSVKVHFDTTLSAGISVKTSSINHQYLPTASGGPLTSQTEFLGPGVPATLPVVPTNTGLSSLNAYVSPITGSQNTDDGRLNFRDKWDLIGNTYKMTNDLQVQWDNYTFFARLNSYYDAVLDDSSSYDRMPLNDGYADAARDVRLLDFYVSGNYDVSGMPLNVRLGKQVISWGESTFLLNGVNSVNPIDVNAFRRPGAEIKEGLVPVWAIDASIGLPYNLSLEAFYQLQWEGYQLDRPGTPFSTADVTGTGTYGGMGFLTGSPGGNMLRNCDPLRSVSAAFDAAWAGAGNALRDCSADAVDYTQYNPTVPGLGGWTALTGGNSEAFRLAMGDSAVVARDQDREPSDSGQYGIAARWYSEQLNNTEFGFYFMNYHSRLPIVSERVTFNPGGADFTTYLLTGGTTNLQSRALPIMGCNLAGGLNTAQPGDLYGLPLGLSVEALNQLNQSVNDSSGVYAAGLALANSFYNDTAPDAVVSNPGASPLAGGIEGLDLAALAEVLAPGGAGPLANLVANWRLMDNPVIQTNSGLAAQIANCALTAMQSTDLDPGAGVNIVAADGTEVLLAADLANPGIGLFLEYPEDIKMYGFSFNTTLGTWGVQGDLTYRPNQPVQLDTDQLTITALNKGCVVGSLLSQVTVDAILPGVLGGNPDTFGGSCGDLYAGAPGIAVTQNLTGYERTDIFTAQVGTTATYSASNPLIGFTGADLGILVTEVGMMYAPDAPSEGAPNNVKRWQNVCVGGTDLPLGGALGLADRDGCRPTTTSWGYVLLGQLQYNNVFGTAVTLNPTVAWSHGVQGNSPAPLNNYRQGAKSVSLQLNGTYQSWRGGISYTNYFGNEKYVGNTDQDFVSMNISYAF